MRLILGFYNIGDVGILEGYVVFGDDKKSGGISLPAGSMSCTKIFKILPCKNFLS